MNATTFERWCYLTSEFRRYADSVDKLAKAVFGNQQRGTPIDLVSMMAAQQSDAVETVEPDVEPKSET
jgi:hypothetical protein